MERETLIFHKEWSDALNKYSKEARIEVYDAIFEYAFTGNTPELSEIARMAFSIFQLQIDKDQAKFNDVVEKRKKAGKKGGKKRGENLKQKQANEANEANASNAKQTKQVQANEANQAEYEIIPTNVGENNLYNIIESNTNVLDSESVSTETDPPIDWSSFINWWNNNVHNTNIPELKTLNEDRRKAVRCRIKEHKKESLGILMQKLVASSFLQGVNNRNFVATFDWVFKKANYTKILEGNYDNKDMNNGTGTNYPTSTPDGRSQREAEVAEIAARLLNSQ